MRIAPLVVADEVRANIFIARAFGGLCLALKTAKKCLGDLFLEVNAREARDHLFAQVFGKCLVSDSEYIQANTIEQELDLQLLLLADAWGGMQRDGIPGGLDSRLGYAMMLQELAGGIRAVNLKAVGGAAELLQQAKIMECGADEQKLHIEFPPRLPAKLICPEEDAVGVVEEQRCAELPEKSGRLASQLRIGYPSSTC